MAHQLLLKLPLRLRLLLCSFASTSTETLHGLLDLVGLNSSAFGRVIEIAGGELVVVGS